MDGTYNIVSVIGARLGIRFLRNAEIRELNGFISCKEHILGFDVSVDISLIMCIFERIKHPYDKLYGGFRVQCSVFQDVFFKGAAFNVFKNDEAAVHIGTVFVRFNDVFML